MTTIQKYLACLGGLAAATALIGWEAIGVHLIASSAPWEMKLMVAGVSIMVPCIIAFVIILIAKDQI